MTIATRLTTADELLRMPDDGVRYELVRGELKKMSPAGEEHCDIAAEILTRLRPYVRKQKLGNAYGSSLGFMLFRNPDTVRDPDVSFVRAERVVKTKKYFPGAPDLAFEVMSPNDRYPEVLVKKDEYLHAGAQAVVIIDPPRRLVEIHRPAGVTTVEDVLAVDDIVPGWQLPLSDIFFD
jgi:Uma2 family endonuclease